MINWLTAWTVSTISFFWLGHLINSGKHESKKPIIMLLFLLACGALLFTSVNMWIELFWALGFTV